MFGKNKVQIKKIFNHFMKPFLEEYGFKCIRNRKREIVYRHSIKLNASIGFHINQIDDGVDITVGGGCLNIQA